MTWVRDLARAVGILLATVAGVAAVTLGLVGFMAPTADPLAQPTSTPEPSFDLAVAPEQPGGSLEVSGDRTGTFTLDDAKGNVGYQPSEDGSITLVHGPTWLTGPDGQIAFAAGSGAVTQVDYDDLSIYVDPGQCSLTLGASNEATGVVSALLECNEIGDIRDRGVINLAGVVALPANVVRGLAHLPPPGGSLQVGERTVDLSGATAFLSGGVIADTGDVPVNVHPTEGQSFLGVVFRPQTNEWLLTGLMVDGELVTISGPCAVTVEDLGLLNEWTSVKRFDFDCPGVVPSAGGSGSIEGSVIVDVIDEGALPGPP